MVKSQISELKTKKDALLLATLTTIQIPIGAHVNNTKSGKTNTSIPNTDKKAADAPANNTPANGAATNGAAANDAAANDAAANGAGTNGVDANDTNANDPNNESTSEGTDIAPPGAEFADPKYRTNPRRAGPRRQQSLDNDNMFLLSFGSV